MALPLDIIEDDEDVAMQSDKTGEDTEDGERTEIPENSKNVMPVPDSDNELLVAPIG